jgi:tRNA A37 methylthiotransferase MiaB
MSATKIKVSLTTLGCSRNEVDSEELAGRLNADGWELVSDPSEAEVVVINTCGFIESAKKDSIDALIEANTLKSSGAAKASRCCWLYGRKIWKRISKGIAGSRCNFRI